MRTKSLVAASLVAVLSLSMLAVPGTASAAKGQGNAPQQPGGVNQCGQKIRLQTTAFGLAFAARANATKRAAQGRQVFTVEVTGLVPDGTVFVVFVNGDTLAGTLTMAVPLGAVRSIGRLDLDTNLGPLPLGVDPVCSITSVLVTDLAGNIVASGSF